MTNKNPPPVPKTGLIELDIIDLAYGGKGVAKVDNFVVFVSNAVPGDRVRANITKRHKNHAEAETVEVLKASPDRVVAP
ncbi:TPA: 23S rRNA (uracil(1939)-C(5))-methyltransferase RlmD, partial [Candidatus Sumerlaeota bacterium]|nr:23S rRNA (uracil(1939)-C(5))-methyltransferase RlmD [Candidatus Sumerlaeota bacterium]